jgi:nitrate ABC transporter ATP-binding subunit
VKRYLELWNLTKAYPGPAGPVVVVDGFTLAVDEGEFVCLIGHSGCGKSTVLSMAAGLVEPTAGGVTVAGREVDGPGPDRGVVFQSPCLLPWMTALDNVRLGIDQVFPDEPPASRRRAAAEILERLGLGDTLHKKPAEMSAGMRQRVGLARAFALRPKALLLDEPFGMLDFLTRIELQQVLLERWSEDRTTALMVTHDVDEALLLSDRVAMMTGGPAAHLGGVLAVPFTRPRTREQVLEDPDYDRLREGLVSFLEASAEGGAPAVSDRSAAGPDG